jgi:hypothetical protein
MRRVWRLGSALQAIPDPSGPPVCCRLWALGSRKAGYKPAFRKSGILPKPVASEHFRGAFIKNFDLPCDSVLLGKLTQPARRLVHRLE